MEATRKYININKSSKEYGNIYEEICFPSRNIVKVRNPIKNLIDYFDKYDLKEISTLSYQNIIVSYQNGNTKLVSYLTNYILSRMGNFIYGERLEIIKNPNSKLYYALCDKDFEEIISFENLNELRNTFKENQYDSDYFNDDKIVISSYYLATTGRLVLAENLIEDLQRKLLEKEPIHNIRTLTKFVVVDKTLLDTTEVETRIKRKMFLSIPWDKQLKIVADEIRKHLNN